MVNHERRFIFVHIPKTGGSSVIETLFPQLVGKWGSYRSHFLPEEYPEPLWREYFTFAFIRNPWDRMVSLYHYWCDGSYLDLGRRAMSFADFCRNYKHVITYQGKPNIHSRPQSDFLRRKSVGISFCGRYENLQRDFAQVCSRLGLPRAKLPHLIPSPNRMPGSYRQYYRGAPPLVDFVAKEFARDIALGGYSF